MTTGSASEFPEELFKDTDAQVPISRCGNSDHGLGQGLPPMCLELSVAASAVWLSREVLVEGVCAEVCAKQLDGKITSIPLPFLSQV